MQAAEKKVGHLFTLYHINQKIMQKHNLQILEKKVYKKRERDFIVKYVFKL